ncbi:MAG: prealbumin-like fold domain-containing protein, partial [Gaiellaceae bacterium]
FESGNDPSLGLGNMVVNTTGNKDWISAGIVGSASYVHLTDVASSNTDDSFTPGQKQDTTCPTVEGHGNPPKDDFTDIASFTEVNGTTGDTYLYGATMRYAANGNASENIELKQGTSGFCPGSATLLARTPGDKLLAIDYLGGGSAVQFHLLTWVASGACNVANDPAPCWGATVVTLDPTTAEGGVNNAAITAANNPISGVALVAGQFAEFGVNLSASGILPATSCIAFAQTVWESRASGSSFVSSTKDIVLENKTISNCGEIKIIKHSNPRGANQVFGFTSNIAGSEISCTLDNTPAAFNLNDSGNTTADNSANTEDCTKVPKGNYTVTEGADPSGYAFASLSCTATSGSTGAQDGTVVKQANISLAAGGLVTCTYTNNQQKGAIKITKTSSKGLNPGLDGATFSITKGGTAISGSPFTTANGGVICVGNLGFGDYVVTETAPPTGYAIDDATGHTVSVSANSTCGDGNEATFAATDTPLTDLVVTATGEAAPAGTTKSQITCTDASSVDIGDSPTANTDPATMTANGLAPGTYSCTVVIDP